MNRTAFWKLIESTRPGDGDGDQHIENLTLRLQGMEPEEIASFEKHVLDLKDEAYDARLLEVLWILTGGGPGDEGLSDFKDWLILQGRSAFEQALKKPERLPELYPPGTSIYCGGLWGVAQTAYEESGTGEDFDALYEGIYGPNRPPEVPRGAGQDPRLEDEGVLEERLR